MVLITFHSKLYCNGFVPGSAGTTIEEGRETEAAKE